MGSKERVLITLETLPQGGLHSFLGLFKAWLKRNGFTVVSRVTEPADYMLAAAWAVKPLVVGATKAIQPNLRVIHRIDGSASDYGRSGPWDRTTRRVNWLADATVYQSEYSKQVTLGRNITSSDGPVIYNPVDTSWFKPPKHKDFSSDRLKIAVVSFSTNSLKGAWRIEGLAQANPDFDFYLVGRFPKVPRTLNNVYLMGELRGSSQLSVLQACHFHLQLSERDACPNVVIEAMACGLPVIYVESGGVPELVGNAGQKLNLSSSKLPTQILRLEGPSLAKTARLRAETNFDQDVIFPKYLEVFRSASRKGWRSTLTSFSPQRPPYRNQAS